MKLGSSKYHAALASSCLLQILLLGASVAHAELIPADRLYVGWPNAGVIGGIPTRTTIYTTVNSTGDTSDRTSVINAALAACPSNQVVLLGAGTFRCGSEITFGSGSGKTLRGTLVNGIVASIIDSRASNRKVLMGNGSADWPWNNTGTALSANAPQGTNILVLASTSAISAGDKVRIYQNDYQSGAAVVMTVNGLGSSQTFHVRVLSKTPTTITLEDPIPFALTTARNAGVHVNADAFAVMCGLEQIKIDASNVASGNGVEMWNTYNCWLRDVEIYNPKSYILYQMNSIHCTIKRCRLDSIQNAGNNGGGHLMERSSLNLIEDSYINHAFPLIEWNFGCSGNVFAYNVIEDSVANIAMDSNHGGHNSFNLFEGNVTPDINPDGFFGSVSHDTFLRNRVHGINGARDGSAGTDSIPVELKRFTRYYNIVGNVLGTSGTWTYEKTVSGGSAAAGPVIYLLGYPNIGNRDYVGTAEPSAGDNWADWGTFPGPSGFQERDLDVGNTLIRKGNYNYANRAIPAGEATADIIPNSYYLSAKPTWFGNLPWPPFDAASPSSNWTNYYTAIPAGYRLLYGMNPPGGPVNQTPVAVATASSKSGTSPLTVAFSSTGSFDPEGVALSYAWTFGDGKTSTAANPTNLYQANGLYSARLTVSDGTNTVSSTNISISVTPPLSSILVTPPSSSVVAGAAQQFTATGNSPDGSTVDLTSLATWTSSSASVATINLNGLATSTAAGVAIITASASGVSGSSTLTVQAVPVAITTASLPSGTVNAAYATTLTASGGALPYSWSLASGALPAGLVINSTSGAIVGTPTSLGTFNFTARVNDAGSPAQSITKGFSISVASVPMIIGNVSAGTQSDTITADSINGMKYTALVSFTATNMFADVGGSPGRYKCAIYSDSGGTPNLLLGESQEVTNPGAGWTSFPLKAPVAISNGSAYWLCIWSDSAAAVNYVGAVSALKYATYNYGTWPNPVTLDTTGTALNYCIYAAGAPTFSPPQNLRVLATAVVP